MEYRLYNESIPDSLETELGLLSRSAFGREGVPTREDVSGHFERADRIGLAFSWDDPLRKEGMEAENDSDLTSIYPAAVSFVRRLGESTVVQDGLAVRPGARSEGVGEQLLDTSLQGLLKEDDVVVGKSQHPWIVSYYQSRGGYPRKEESLEEAPQDIEQSVREFTETMGVDIDDEFVVQSGYEQQMYEEAQWFEERLEELTETEISIPEGDYFVTVTYAEDLLESSKFMEAPDLERGHWKALEEMDVKPVSPLLIEQNVDSFLGFCSCYDEPRILDFGSGSSVFADEALQNIDGAEVVRADLEPRENGEADMVKAGSFDTFKRDSFDVITCFNVMQELKKPLKDVESAYEVLKSGGSFLATFPGPLSIPQVEKLEIDFSNLEYVEKWTDGDAEWIEELPKFEQRTLSSGEVESLSAPFGEFYHSRTPAGMTDRTETLLESQGYDFPPVPMVDYVVGVKC